ncbi:MAG: hypothetical protein AAGU04_01820 [Anaerolineaceae bacterium]
MTEQESNAALRSVPCEINTYAVREIASQAHDDGALVILNEGKNLLTHDDVAPVILNEVKNLLIQKQDPSLAASTL